MVPMVIRPTRFEIFFNVETGIYNERKIGSTVVYFGRSFLGELSHDLHMTREKLVNCKCAPSST